DVGNDAGGADAAPDSGAPPDRVRFVDVTESAGLQHVHRRGSCDGSSDSLECGATFFTGGAAAGDYNGDGLPDLFVTRHGASAILYRNVGNGTFEDVTDTAGVGADNANGAAFADVDDDGNLDLFVTSVHGTSNLLYMNQGDGTFVEEAEARGVSLADGRPHLGMSACFGDYDRDGWPDLHVTHWDPEPTDSETQGRTRLLRNRGNEAPGHFEDVTDTTGVNLQAVATDAEVKAFTSTFTDLDGDGWSDLVVVADRGETQVFWNDGDGTFSHGTPNLGADVPSDENGTGLAVGDFDADGLVDLFVTSVYDDRSPCAECDWGNSGNRLYRNLGSRDFTDATDVFGVREGGWGGGAAPFDADNDGDLDLVMTNGHLAAEETVHPFHDDPVRFWEQTGDGSMDEVAAEAGLTDTGSGKALITFDFDGDGDLDIFIANNDGPPKLYRNDGPGGRFLRIRARGRGPTNGGSDRRGLGARVEVRIREGAAPMIRELGTCGLLGQGTTMAHFGVGDAERLHEVRISWPAADEDVVLRDVDSNQVLIINEPG
ncbi:MAG: CRTAC1 family protein, partial [Myxococcota bacterium]